MSLIGLKGLIIVIYCIFLKLFQNTGSQKRIQDLSYIYLYDDLHACSFDHLPQMKNKYTLNKYQQTLNLGTNLAHSCCQLCKVDAGAMTRNGPQIPWACNKIKYMQVAILHTDDD